MHTKRCKLQGLSLHHSRPYISSICASLRLLKLATYQLIPQLAGCKPIALGSYEPRRSTSQVAPVPTGTYPLLFYY